MDFKKIKFEVENGVASIVMSAPKTLNAFDAEMLEDVINAVSICEKEEAIKVVVLRTDGKHFSGGGDVREMKESLERCGKTNFDVSIPKIAAFSASLKKIPKPVIAVTKGAVAGAAFNIVLACDLCIAAENTKFMQAFVNLGLVPDAGGLYLLTKAVGAQKARELAFTGDVVTAEEGKALGFVYRVCQEEELEEKADEIIRKFAEGPGFAYGKMKEIMFKTFFADMEAYFKLEAEAQIACSCTNDFKESVFAFVEKRKPQYKGN